MRWPLRDGPPETIEACRPRRHWTCAPSLASLAHTTFGQHVLGRAKGAAQRTVGRIGGLEDAAHGRSIPIGLGDFGQHQVAS